jgi:transcriptional regulator with XRE-family HTH domain/quercetin dioxygenase-like cupin family protein
MSPSEDMDAVTTDIDSASGPASVGGRLRRERERQGIGVREMSRRVHLSASLISQIELGRATPSVGTLYAIVNELNISLDALFFEDRGVSQTDSAALGGDAGPDADPGVQHASQRRPPAVTSRPVPQEADTPTRTPVVRVGDRQSIHLGSGVTWERMSPETEHGVDFLYVIYDIGGASAPERSLMRHAGREYGHLLEGRLNVTIGFETYKLLPGDAISFDSTAPHRLFNPGDGPAKAIWFVVGRDDPRFPTIAAAAAHGRYG